MPDIAMYLNAGSMGRQDVESETLIPTFGGGFDVAHSLRVEGVEASEDGTGRGTPLVPVIAPCLTGNYGKQPDSSDTSSGPMLIPVAIQAGALRENPNSGPNGVGVQEHIAYTLEARAEVQAVAFNLRAREGGAMPEVDADSLANLRAASGGSSRTYVAQHAVRRLTPRECERLQGFKDDYTLVPFRGKPAADGPRYKALGNSMAVPCMYWIGKRIQMVDDLFAHEREIARVA